MAGLRFLSIQTRCQVEDVFYQIAGTATTHCFIAVTSRSSYSELPHGITHTINVGLKRHVMPYDIIFNVVRSS
jgi:hypothetical protein